MRNLWRTSRTSETNEEIIINASEIEERLASFNPLFNNTHIPVIPNFNIDNWIERYVTETPPQMKDYYRGLLITRGAERLDAFEFAQCMLLFGDEIKANRKKLGEFGND